MSGLVLVETISAGRPLTVKEQVFGARSSEVAAAGQVLLATPHGNVLVRREGGSLLVEGDGVPSGQVTAPDPLSIGAARRGLRGQVGSIEFVMRRPRFGVRLEHRSVVLDAESTRWRSIMRSFRHFEIRSCDMSGSVVATSSGGETRVSTSLSAEQLVLALLFERCGIIQSSSLVNYLSI